MSAHITTILTGIKTIVASELGSTYSELPFAYDVSANSGVRDRKGYAVILLDASESSSTTRMATIDQQFQVILHEFFLSSQSGDSNKNSVIVSLYEKMLNIYASLISNKAGASSVVMIVDGVSIDTPEVMDDKDFITLRMTFNVKHRYSF